jgi:hypothetical protein
LSSSGAPSGPVSGTPDFLKYFWARMSVATADHAWGTAIPSWRKTVEPSGFLISDTRASKSMPA